MNSLIKLRNQIFPKSKTERILGKSVKSNWDKLINYYPPNISTFKLGKQDQKLDSLGLRDRWLDSRIDREIMFKKRNKSIRVSGKFIFNFCIVG
jgi:hypothetical protein